MSRHVVCLALLLVSAVSVGETEAQIVRRIRDRARALVAPPVDPVPPAPTGTPPAEASSPAPPAPLARRGGFIARRLQMRRDLVAQQAAEAEPTPAPPAPPQQTRAQQSQAYAQRQQPAQQRQALAPQRQAFQALRQASAAAPAAVRARSQQEIAGMDVPQLQTALSDTSASLANELNRFSSAASWQGFFNLPAGIVDEGAIDLAALQTALLRFEKVARDRQFTQIAGLESFQQARTMLTELLNRVEVPVSEPSANETLADEGPQLIAPGVNAEPRPAASISETLPAPVPQLPRNEGEHSILLRAGS